MNIHKSNFKLHADTLNWEEKKSRNHYFNGDFVDDEIPEREETNYKEPKQ